MSIRQEGTSVRTDHADCSTFLFQLCLSGASELMSQVAYALHDQRVKLPPLIASFENGFTIATLIRIKHSFPHSVAVVPSFPPALPRRIETQLIAKATFVPLCLVYSITTTSILSSTHYFYPSIIPIYHLGFTQPSLAATPAPFFLT